MINPSFNARKIIMIKVHFPMVSVQSPLKLEPYVVSSCCVAGLGSVTYIGLD
jgi:hypothetical protein